MIALVESPERAAHLMAEGGWAVLNPVTVRTYCDTFWGSHGCSLPDGHSGAHQCGGDEHDPVHSEHDGERVRSFLFEDEDSGAGEWSEWTPSTTFSLDDPRAVRTVPPDLPVGTRLWVVTSEGNLSVPDEDQGLVLGTVTVDSPVLPIVDDPDLTGVTGQCLLWDAGEREATLCSSERGWHSDVEPIDGAWWPDDPVGRYAVKLTDPVPTTERCPVCQGTSMVHCDCMERTGVSTLHMGHPCPTCEQERHCPPFPLSVPGAQPGDVVEVE